MKKKFTSKGKKSLALVMALSLTFGVFITSDALMAEEEITILTKEAFVEEVLKDNSTIAGLEDQIEDMEEQLEDLPTYTNYLATFHQYAIQYNELGNKLEKTQEYVENGELSSEYNEKLSLVIQNTDSPGAYVARLSEIAAGEPDIKANLITGSEMLTYKAYGELLSQFFGLTGSTITPDEEYETFIVPIFTSENELESGIASLKEGIVSTSDSFEVGAKQLYNTVLMFEEVANILELSYETSKTNYETAKSKYEVGLLSETTLNTSYNDMVSAQLSVDKMYRDIDNFKMNMNVMMGREPAIEFTVVDSEEESKMIKLFNVSVYTDEALEQRSEIISLNRSIDNQDYKRFFVGQTFEESDNQYIIEKKELELLELDLKNTRNEITVEIHNSYNNVLETERALEIAYLDLNDAKRQYNELAINVEQGFVTQNTLNQLNLLITNAVNEVATKSRDYLTAVEDLTNGSSFGTGK